MTAATVAQPSGTQFAVLLVMFLIVSFITVIGFYLHGRMWDAHERELATNAQQLGRLDYRLESLLEFLGADIPEPVDDDSPEALQVYGGLADVDKPDDDAQTDEFPVAPATVPDGMPLVVQSALIEARDLSDERPHPVDSDERKAKNAAEIEKALKRFDFSGRNR